MKPKMPKAGDYIYGDSTMISENEEFIKFKAEFDKLREKETVWIQINPISAWAVISAIQLACRHPEFNGYVSVLAKEAAQQLQVSLFNEGILAEVAQKGWNSEYDL